MKLKVFLVRAEIAHELATVHTLFGRGVPRIHKDDVGNYYIDTDLSESDLRFLTAYAAALHLYHTRLQEGVDVWCLPERVLYDPEYELALTALGICSYTTVPTSPLDDIVYVGEVDDYL